MEPSATTSTLAASPAPQRRRSQRVSLAVPVVITSLDPGAAFKEHCQTIVVSPLGCLVRSSQPLQQGAKVQLDLVGRKPATTTARVAMGARLAKDKVWEIGLEFEVASNFWGIEFPGGDRQATAPAGEAKSSAAASEPAAIPEAASLESTPLASPVIPALPPAVAQARPAAPAAPPAAPPAPLIPPAVPSPAVSSPDVVLADLEPALREKAKAISAEFESDYRKSLGELLLRLRADLEERASQDWERLQNQARASLQEMSLAARREWESQPPGVSVGEFEAALEQALGAQLKILAGIMAGQLKTARDQMLAQASQELEGLLLQARRQQEESAARQAAEQASLEARVESNLRATDYVESLARTLPQIVDQRAQEAVATSMQLAQKELAEQFSASRLAQQLVEIAEPAANELRQRLFEDFDRHEREFLDRVSVRVEEATAAAAQTREYVQHWHAEMDRRLQQSVADSRSQMEEKVAGRELQAQSALHQVAEHAAKAEAAAEHLRALLESLLEERKKLEGENQALRRQSEEVRAWLHQERDEIQQMMQGALAEARGEIRGRVHQGVETFEDLVENRCRESASRLEEITGRQSKDLAEKLEHARDRLHTLHDETQKAMLAKLNARLAEVLGRFQQQTDKLAQETITECQADMGRILDSTKLP